MYIFKKISSSEGPPRVTSMMAEFFGATIIEPIRQNRVPASHEIVPPMHLCKNVYAMPDVFPAAARLVLSEKAVDALTGVYVGRYTECALDICYDYPYSPGNFSYERDPAFLDECGDTAIISRRLAAAYACERPAGKYFELMHHRPRDILADSRGWSDTRHIRLEDSVNGLLPVDCEISPSMVEEFGLIWNYGFFCRDDVFMALDPLLRRPYFWTGRINRLL